MRKIAFAITLSAFCICAAPHAVADSLADSLRNGKVFGELRYRYEYVEQDGLPNAATANTLRANFGFETGAWHKLQALVELQAVRHIGNDSFNDTTNGKAFYPAIADPENSEINQAWVIWSGLPNTTLKLGRQAVNLDNQRFAGAVNWRQNDQTFDALTAMFKPAEKVLFNYGYVWNVNRIFGEHHAIPDYSGDSHLLHGEYLYANWLKLAAYSYLIDVKEAPQFSSRTFGAQATGEAPLPKGFKFQYLAEYARQSDAGGNPGDYNEAYIHLTPSLLWKGFTVQGGFESLGGSGISAVQTPYATLHIFNGWADKFLTTPPDGLEDQYGRLSYRHSSSTEWLNGITADAIYHDFRAENGSDRYGSEWNLQLSKTFKAGPFGKEWTVALKYADYQADQMFTDTRKAWMTTSVKF
jgi:hypothetical protein